MSDNFERFVASQVAVIFRDDRFLILQFSDNKKWGLPGGRVDKGETGKEALKRELKEEIGMDSFRYLGVADYDFYYYQDYDGEIVAKCDLVNLIKNDDSDIILSPEHDDFRWIRKDDVGEYDFVWRNIQRMADNAFKLKKLLEKNNEK